MLDVETWERLFGEHAAKTARYYAISGSYAAFLAARTVDAAIDEVRRGGGVIDHAREAAAADEDSLEDPQTWDIFEAATDEEVACMIDVEG